MPAMPVVGIGLPHPGAAGNPPCLSAQVRGFRFPEGEEREGVRRPDSQAGTPSGLRVGWSPEGVGFRFGTGGGQVKLLTMEAPGPLFQVDH